MRVILKAEALVFSPETEDEREAFAAWMESATGHVFHFAGGSPKGAALFDLGPREEACREPINIVFDETEPQWQPISNLAPTPFTLDGVEYASVEGFWQGLKFPSVEDRARLAALYGIPARKAGAGMPRSESFVYQGEVYATGGAEHRGLMRLACGAKFRQHAGAREALLSTGNRPLTHRTRRDSETIPGALMADMWMRLREELRRSGPG
jgi:predicted NAD-dependent protein-ADP-ribosyltransferase YbiA (DUF1768 family)